MNTTYQSQSVSGQNWLVPSYFNGPESSVGPSSAQVFPYSPLQVQEIPSSAFSYGLPETSIHNFSLHEFRSYIPPTGKKHRPEPTPGHWAQSCKSRASVAPSIDGFQPRSVSDVSREAQQLNIHGVQPAQITKLSEELTLKESEELKTPEFADSSSKLLRCKIEKCKRISFSTKDTLSRHERQVHGTSRHLCPNASCERFLRGFSQRYNLKDHIRRVHGPKRETLKVKEEANFSMIIERQQRTEHHYTVLNEQRADEKELLTSACCSWNHCNVSQKQIE